MMVFWWQGQGWRVIAYLFGSLLSCGLLVQVFQGLIPDRPLTWAIAFFAAAGINWHFGSRHNARSRARRVGRTGSRRLFYDARHRFMSLPMESFSLVFVLVGCALIGQAIAEL